MMTPVLVDSASFQQEVLRAEQPVVVDFFVPSCMECARLKPVVHHLAHAFQDAAKVCLLNVAEAPEIAQQYHIMHSPTLVFFKNGQPVDTLLGYQDAAHLTARLQRVLTA